MDAAAWTAIVGPITTLLGGLGGYWIAGRNDDARDRRAAEREASAHRAAFSERLEQERHGFQRDTLLELQDELHRLVRNATQILIQDEKTINQSGQLYLLPGELSDEGMKITFAIQRLRARILDDRLRTDVGEFVSLCSASRIPSVKYPHGQVHDSDREQAIASLRVQNNRIGDAYVILTDQLGIQLRSELDRRFLAATPDKSALPETQNRLGATNDHRHKDP